MATGLGMAAAYAVLVAAAASQGEAVRGARCRAPVHGGQAGRRRRADKRRQPNTSLLLLLAPAGSLDMSTFESLENLSKAFQVGHSRNSL